MKHTIPYILVVGRPNVGKSSFFNAMVGHKIAIVSDIENTTRDVLEFTIEDSERNFSYVVADSGGVNFGSDNEILDDVTRRVIQYANEADLVLFLTESGIKTDLDIKISKMLHKTGKPVLVLPNKADNPDKALASYEYANFGFSDIIPISVSHRKAFDEIKDYIVEFFHDWEEEIEVRDDIDVHISLVGRPNVGKSSILNALLKEDRVMVSGEAGTTRDSTDTYITHEDKTIAIIDTAGMRKPGKIGRANIEDWSVLRSKRALGRCDVAVIVIDGIDGVTSQDKHIIQEAMNEEKGIVIVINKWDEVVNKTQRPDTIREEFLGYLKQHLAFLPWAPIIFTTAISGRNVEEILKSALGIQEQRKQRITTGVFNNFLTQMVYKHPPTGNKKSHKPKIFYGSQVDVSPPKFVVSVNNPDQFHFSYKRYLENNIREFFGFMGTPISIEFKGRGKNKDIVK